jgi:hypothetical protein
VLTDTSNNISSEYDCYSLVKHLPSSD